MNKIIKSGSEGWKNFLLWIEAVYFLAVFFAALSVGIIIAIIIQWSVLVCLMG